jgi:hypothetical protein
VLVIVAVILTGECRTNGGCIAQLTACLIVVFDLLYHASINLCCVDPAIFVQHASSASYSYP